MRIQTPAERHLKLCQMDSSRNGQQPQGTDVSAPTGVLRLYGLRALHRYRGDFGCSGFECGRDDPSDFQHIRTDPKAEGAMYQ